MTDTAIVSNFEQTSLDPDAVLLLTENDDLIHLIMEFVDFPTLMRMQRVCRYWKRMVIDRSMPGRLGRKKITTRVELIRMIKKYCNFPVMYAEELARTYGWPIGRWNVSQVTNFSYAFGDQPHFNEDIREWDMSNATDLHGMFIDARAFNQDISQWDTSQVIYMYNMFAGAASFNQDISTWRVQNVRYHEDMFNGALSFHEDYAPHFTN
mmetsp:Transcript_29027/g.43856  ORF Transcript_29027/g.43856 Transcript_29027/m.43856 type:complete len:209 (+) Transcript_29027:96-722(+)